MCIISFAQMIKKKRKLFFMKPRPLISVFLTHSLNSFLPITVSSSSSFLFADFSWKSLKCFIICFNLGSVLRNPVASKALAAKVELKLVFGDDDDRRRRACFLGNFYYQRIIAPICRIDGGLSLLKWVSSTYFDELSD